MSLAGLTFGPAKPLLKLRSTEWHYVRCWITNPAYIKVVTIQAIRLRMNWLLQNDLKTLEHWMSQKGALWCPGACVRFVELLGLCPGLEGFTSFPD